jgi:predicted short-subunit dehydrogenase-like oxidoreductase (DUF2520 family)
VKKGYEVVEVYSKTSSNAKQLANRLKCKSADNINELIESDLAIIAVNDDSIASLSKQIHKPQIHTSGTKGIKELSNHNFPTGVFYPVQTFSKNNDIVFDNIPICIEASSNDFLKIIHEIAKKLSNKVYCIDSEKRAQLHLSAVIACNFPNLLYQIAKELCDQSKVPFEILHPLIGETAKKIQFSNPENNQTGPAKRNDLQTINNHLEKLNQNPEILKIYQILTESIKKRS